MNPIEQKTHTRVTTEIARDLESLTTVLITQLQTVGDRLDLHQLELAANQRETAGLHLELDRLEDRVRRLKCDLHDDTDPLHRDLGGRLRWLLTGT